MFFLFSSLVYFCFLLALKPISLLLKRKNNEASEYEACYRSSTLNNITKSESNFISLLTVFSATYPSTTIFPLANLVIFLQLLVLHLPFPQLLFLLLPFTFLLIEHLINDILIIKNISRILLSSIIVLLKIIT